MRCKCNSEKDSGFIFDILHGPKETHSDFKTSVYTEKMFHFNSFHAVIIYGKDYKASSGSVIRNVSMSYSLSLYPG